MDIRYYDGAGRVVQSGPGAGLPSGYIAKLNEGVPAGESVGTETRINRFDANGHLVGITDSRMAANNRTYVNDAQGRILTSTYTQSANVQRQLIANGEVLGRHGVGIDPLKPRNSNGTPRFLAMADFNFGYQPIRGNQIAASGGQHTVAAGDTLEMIARGAYGDGQLWYRIAEANGLTGNTDLVVGQTLVIPNNVSTNANNSDTWRPYNAAEMIGDTTPHLPVPKDSCGPMGQVLMIVVAVVVTIYTAGAAAGVMAQAGSVAAATAASGAAGTMAVGAGVLAGGGAVTAGLTTGAMIGAAAIGGAVGSIASQLVGNAIGAVDGFSWKSVATSALSAGVTAGAGHVLGAAGQGLQGAQKAAAVAGRAALTNAATQGIAVATGLQRQFNWMSVAASAVGAGMGSSVNGAVAGTFGGTFGGRLATGVLSGAAAGVATVQVMADAFGNALGNSIVDEMRFSVAQAPTAGGGLKLKPGTAESWGPKLSFGGDVQLPRDYSLGGGAEVRFSTDGMETAASPDSGPRTGVASKEAAQGAWGIAKSLAGAGASNTEINRIKNQLLTLNPELAKSVRVGQEYVLPGADTPENTALAQQADQRYAAAQEQARARAEAQERARIDQLLASAGPRGGAGVAYGDAPRAALAPSAGTPQSYPDYGDLVSPEFGGYSGQGTVLDPDGGRRFVGTVLPNIAKGVVQGTIGMAGDAVKGWAMIGDTIVNGGRNISRIDDFNVRPFAYDPALGEAAGVAGEILSPAAMVKGVQLGAQGLKTLGPTLEAAAYNLMSRQGLVLHAVPPGGGAANPVAPFSHLVPGGGLAAHEAAGGHLLARHVGRAEADLAARLAAQPRLGAASTFANRAEAEAAISGALNARAADVNAWIAAGAQGRQVVEAAFSGGSVLQRGATAVVPGTGVRAILEGTGGGRWRIITGYPTP